MKHTLKDYMIVGAVFIAVFFVFSAFTESLKSIGQNQVALVSEMGATIKETPTNKLAAQLRERNDELNEREKILNERELALAKERDAVNNRVRNILVTTISLAVLTLFITNSYIYRRDKTRLRAVIKHFGNFPLHTPKQNYQVDLHNSK